MNVPTTFYSVAASKNPCTREKTKLFGYYMQEEAAEEAADFIKQIYANMKDEITVTVRELDAELITCPTGYRVKQVYDASVTQVFQGNKLSSFEFMRLNNIHL